MELPKWNKVAWLAAFFTAAMLAVNYLFTFVFGSSVKSSLFGIVSYPGMIPTPVQTFGPGLGNTILGWIGQYVAIPAVPSIIALFLSAFVLIYAGSWIVSMGAPTVKGKIGNIFSVVAYGTILGYALLVGMSVPANATTTIIGIVIYTAVASYVAALLGNVFKQEV